MGPEDDLCSCQPSHLDETWNLSLITCGVEYTQRRRNGTVVANKLTDGYANATSVHKAREDDVPYSGCWMLKIASAH